MLSLGDALICLTQVQLISFIIIFIIRTLKNKKKTEFSIGKQPHIHQNKNMN